MGTTNDLVSIIVPSFNMARFLPEAMKSALAQSYANIEVLIVDDGSTDDTPEVVRQWESDPRVRVHRQANGGLSHARNQGIALTRGPFIALLDADDTWSTDKLSRQMKLFEGRAKVGVVYSDFALMDREGKSLPRGPMRMHRGWVSGALLIENFVPASSAVVRRKCFELYGGFDTRLRTGEDYDMWLRLSPHFQFEFLAEPVMQYRIGGWQMSKDYRARYETGIRTMQNFLDNNPDVVDRAVVRKAWAHTYTGRGNVTLWRGRDRVSALRDYVRALTFQPGYWPAWRAILRSLITSREPL